MFRYIDFPVAIKKPDFEKISQFDGCDISAVNENSKNLFKVLYLIFKTILRSGSIE